MKRSALTCALLLSSISLNVCAASAVIHTVPPEQETSTVAVTEDDLTNRQPSANKEDASGDIRGSIAGDVSHFDSEKFTKLPFDCSSIERAKMGPERVIVTVVSAKELTIAPPALLRIGRATCTAAAGAILEAAIRGLDYSWLNKLDVFITRNQSAKDAGFRRNGNSRWIEVDAGLLLDKNIMNIQLAAMFAHEIGHGLYDHISLRESTRWTGLATLGGAAYIFGKAGKTIPGKIATAGLTAAGAYLVSCGPSRASLLTEQQADIFGVNAMARVLGSLSEGQRVWSDFLRKFEKIDVGNDKCVRKDFSGLNDNAHPEISVRLKAIEQLKIQVPAQKISD